jgi:predicted xylose isomerase-like sugar epimerase
MRSLKPILRSIGTDGKRQCMVQYVGFARSRLVSQAEAILAIQTINQSSNIASPR